MNNNKEFIQINYSTEIKLNFNVKEFIKNALNIFNFQLIFFELSFTNDEQIKQIHNQYLNLNTTTDVITFNLNNLEEPHGDIYICIDEAKRNAKSLNHCLDYEIKTLIIHALLHLIGYTDTTKAEKEKMFKEQDRLLNLLTTA
jgi:probable rRNA maturation factor